MIARAGTTPKAPRPTTPMDLDWVTGVDVALADFRTREVTVFDPPSGQGS
jgi:hypothetical protein